MCLEKRFRCAINDVFPSCKGITLRLFIRLQRIAGFLLTHRGRLPLCSNSQQTKAPFPIVRYHMQAKIRGITSYAPIASPAIAGIFHPRKRRSFACSRSWMITQNDTILTVLGTAGGSGDIENYLTVFNN
jgi:hypothetical protein